MKKEIVKALEAEGVVDKTDNMFTSSEYARAAGIKPRWARERLAQLEAAGKLRRVRFRVTTSGGVRVTYPGWEYIGASR